MRKPRVLRFLVLSLLFVAVLGVVGYVARDALVVAFLYDGTRADYELLQMRREKTSELPPDVQGSRRDRCFEIAEENRGTRAEITAYLFVTKEWPSTADSERAHRELMRVAGTADISDLSRSLGDVGVNGRTVSADIWRLFARSLIDRAAAEPEHPKSARLLCHTAVILWPDTDAESTPPELLRIADMIRIEHATSPELAIFCEVAGNLGNPVDWSKPLEPHVERILEVNEDRFVRCSAHFALAAIVRADEKRQAEAGKLYRRFLKDFDGQRQYHALAIEQTYRGQAEQILEMITALGIGKEAPETDGFDLNGNAVSLADYRGRVVLVSFWASWCYPCLQAVSHERELLKVFGSNEFAILGINGDDDLDAAEVAAKEYGITWPSLRKGTHAEAWNIVGYPTFYLLDRRGRVAKTWMGLPPRSRLHATVQKLIGVEAVTAVEPSEAALTTAGVKAEQTQIDVEQYSTDATGFVERTIARRDGSESRYVVFIPEEVELGREHPALLFLHGSGAIGTDGRRQLRALANEVNRRRETFPLVAIFPQSPAGDWRLDSGNGNLAMEILEDVMETFPIDSDRVALSGVSMGGEGTWHLAASYPQRWSAIVPMCGGGDPETAEAIAHIPCWCFHGQDDRMIPPVHSHRMIRALRQAGGQPIYIEYPGVGHDVWTHAYRHDDLYDWLIDQRRPNAGSR